jgi:anti-anti-sigma regulatory factor
MLHEHEAVRFVIAIVDGKPTIHGECDLDSAMAIESLAAFDMQPLEIDLSGVTFFDSLAVRAFLRVRRRNPHMIIINPSDCVLKALELVGVSFLTTSESVD